MLNKQVILTYYTCMLLGGCSSKLFTQWLNLWYFLEHSYQHDALVLAHIINVFVIWWAMCKKVIVAPPIILCVAMKAVLTFFSSSIKLLIVDLYILLLCYLMLDYHLFVQVNLIHLDSS